MKTTTKNTTTKKTLSGQLLARRTKRYDRKSRVNPLLKMHNVQRAFEDIAKTSPTACSNSDVTAISAWATTLFMLCELDNCSG